MSQVHKVVLSPAQRWSLLQLSHAQKNRIANSGEGRKYRRFCEAFGVKAIADVAREHEGDVATAAAADEKALATHEVTAENVEYALGLLNGEKSPLQEDLLGPLTDALEELKAGREVTWPEAPPFDPLADREKWKPA